MAASRGGRLRGRIGRKGAHWCFRKGKGGADAAVQEQRVGRVDRVLLTGLIAAHSPPPTRSIAQMGGTHSLTACIPPGGPWRRCQFQAPRSRPSLEDYPIRIDKHVRDRILLGRFVISTTECGSAYDLHSVDWQLCQHTETHLSVRPTEATINHFRSRSPEPAQRLDSISIFNR